LALAWINELPMYNWLDAYLTKVALALKPFHKFTYLLAAILVANIIYQLAFTIAPSAVEPIDTMLNLLALAWVVLVNLMIQIFSQAPVILESKSSFWARIKNRFYRGVYYTLSLVFIVISFAVIFLSFKMLRI